MDKMITSYDRYLSAVCYCDADKYGNRPCDYGIICDNRCEQQEISFKQWHFEKERNWYHDY